MRNSYKHGRGFLAAIYLVLLTSFAAPAAAVTVDGNLADLIAASANPDTGATATDTNLNGSGADAENNGFDITNMYSFFDIAADVFYMGFETVGPVGDHCNPNNSGTTCMSFFTPNPNFDSAETIWTQIDFGNLVFNGGSVDAQLLLTGDGLGTTGPDTATSIGDSGGNPIAGVTFAWAVSEADDGVELSISGLLTSGTIPGFGPSNPLDFSIRFVTGTTQSSGCTGCSGDDEAFLSGTLVPVPAAIWLFGSGLLGLAGFARKGKRHL